jgi:hypothetical protein
MRAIVNMQKSQYIGLPHPLAFCLSLVEGLLGFKAISVFICGFFVDCSGIIKGLFLAFSTRSLSARFLGRSEIGFAWGSIDCH